MEDFRISPNYRGDRNIRVPVKMYSRHSLLMKVGVQSRRWLGVDLDRYSLTFHKDKFLRDPRDEINFWQIRSVDADISESYRNRYFLNVATIDNSYKFKFRNVRDFYEVVEALRHTLQNNQPFYVTKDDYSKLVGLHQQSIFAKPNQISTLSTVDFSEDEFDQTTGATKHTHKTTTTTMKTNPGSMQSNMMPVTATYHESQIIPAQAAPIVPEENLYQKWKHLESPVKNIHDEKKTTVHTEQFNRIFDTPAQPISPKIETRTSRVTESRFVDQPASPIYSPINRVTEVRRSFVELPSPAMSPSPRADLFNIAPVNTPVDMLSSSSSSERLFKTTTTTTSTVVPPPTTLSPTGRFTHEDWSQVEMQLAHQENMLAMKQEELRQREAVLHMQKINAKRAEIEARNEALREKEFELYGIEKDIRGIQTEIGQVKNSQVMDRLRSSDHKNEVEKTRLITNYPIVTAVPGEIVEVTTKDIRTFSEEQVAQPPMFASQAPTYNSGYKRY